MRKGAAPYLQSKTWKLKRHANNYQVGVSPLWPISAVTNNEKGSISRVRGSRVIENLDLSRSFLCVHRSTPPDDLVTAPARLTVSSATAALFAEHAANLDGTPKPNRIQSDSQTTEWRWAQDPGVRQSKHSQTVQPEWQSAEREGHRVSAVSKASACFLTAAIH